MTGKAIIDAEFEVVKPRRSVLVYIKHYATLALIFVLIIFSALAFTFGAIWIGILIYEFFWSVIGALVAIFGGLIMFTWSATKGADVLRKWRAR